jgi:hypothetical protein
MSQTQLCGEFSVETYNHLRSIEEADRLARVNGQLDQFLREAAALFVRHNMQERFGIALLHRHHVCDSDERMVQYYHDSEDEKALLTRPVCDEATPGTETPHVWAIFDGAYRPLEFTTDGCVRHLFFMGDVPSSFLTDLSELLKASPVGHLFGLAVVKRTLSEGADDTQVLLEHSNIERRESTVHLRNRDETQMTITTAWTFGSLKAGNTIVSETECVATQRCQCIVDDPGVPGYPPVHSHVPEPHHVQRPS